MPRNNAHFVPVKYCGRTHCVTGKPLPLDTDYQAAVEGVDASERLQRFCDVCFVEHRAPCLTLMQLRTSWWCCHPNRRCRLQSSGSSAEAARRKQQLKWGKQEENSELPGPQFEFTWIRK